MKNNLGVTLVELVVVIVILLIIATFAINSGVDTLDEADVTEVFVEMTSVKSALSSVALKKEIDPNIQIVQGEYYDALFSPLVGVTYGDNVLGNQEKWFVIYGIDNKEEYDSSSVRGYLGLDTLNHTYIVNYETSEVELLKPVTIKDLEVRTYSQVREIAEK